MILNGVDSIYVDGSPVRKVLANSRIVWSLPMELPTGYKQCKYLEFNRQQRFNIPSNMRDGDTVVSVSKNAGDYNYNTIWGVSANAEVYYYTADETVTIYYSGAEIVSWESVGDGTRVTCRAVRNTNMYWIGDYGAGDERYMLSGRVYDFRVIRRSGRIVRLLIPCIDINGTPCFFDAVSGAAFYSDVNCGYELMDGTYVPPPPQTE